MYGAQVHEVVVIVPSDGCPVLPVQMRSLGSATPASGPVPLQDSAFPSSSCVMVSHIAPGERMRPTAPLDATAVSTTSCLSLSLLIIKHKKTDKFYS